MIWHRQENESDEEINIFERSEAEVAEFRMA